MFSLVRRLLFTHSLFTLALAYSVLIHLEVPGMKTSRYQSLTVKRKLEIIDRVENLPPGKKKKDVASEFKIPPSTLSTILKNKDVLKSSSGIANSKKKCQREPTRVDVDTALFQWFTAARANNIPISGEILKAKAEELSEELDPSMKWVCSSGWLSRWKRRHSIHYRVLSGESASVDKDMCDYWKQNILLPVLQRYQPADIFNADETGLFWRLLPDKTHSVSGEVCAGGKK